MHIGQTDMHKVLVCNPHPTIIETLIASNISTDNPCEDTLYGQTASTTESRWKAAESFEKLCFED